MTKPIIGFAGMTHLGLNSSVAAAEKGFQTIGFDTNATLTAELSGGKTAINEPDLSELMQKNAQRLEFTSDTSVLGKCDIVYISIDVPTNDKGQSNLAPIRDMVELVDAHIREDALMVILCQVPPGFTRSLPRDPAHLYYQVETLIFGRAMERALYPERYIIGCSDPDIPLDPRYIEFLDAYDCPRLPMRYESAELGKTAINLFLAASVCTANSLAEVCEKIGADWNEIIPALRLDRRIGQYAYIETGLGLSGGNIERDLTTVSDLGYEHGAKSTVIDSYITHSKYRKQWPIKQFYQHYDGGDCTACVLGLAYKINTHSIKNSPSVDLIEALPDITIQAYDPVVKALPENLTVTHAQSAYDAAKDADMLFIMTPWDEFKELDWPKLVSTMRGKTVIDPFRLAQGKFKVEDGITHIMMGRAA